MKAIRQRLLILSGLCSLGLLASLTVFTSSLLSDSFNISLPMITTASLTALLTFLSFREHGKLSFAQMIVENKIMLIRAAQVEKKLLKSSLIEISSDTVDIYVSCFGILLGSRIIKFNTEGINLKRVDIGQDSVSIYFGKGENEQFIRLLNRAIDENELGEIVWRFHHETGIAPNIVADI